MPITITMTGDTAEVDAALNRLKTSVTQSTSAVQGAMASATQATQQMSQRAQQHLDSLSTALQRTGAATATALSAFERLRQAQAAGDSAAALMSRGLQGLSQQVVRSTVEQGNLSKALLQTGQASQTQLNAFQRLSRQYQDTSQASDKAADSQKKFGTAISGTVTGLRSMAASFGLILGASGLVTFLKSMVDAGLQMERFERTLTAATGSSKAAAEAWRFITTESNRLGQSVTEMVPIFVQLTAATRNTVLEGERTRELFSALAGAGQAVGLSTEAVGGAMLGLTQIISQNAIQLDEFRNQFASRIPGAMLETAKALKVLGVTQKGTIAEMLKGFERGAITIPQFAQAVTMALKEIQRTAPEMGNTAAAAFTQLSNAVFQLKADLARSGLLEFMTNMAQTARGLLARVREAIGLGGKDFLGQVGTLQGKLSELRQAREELLQEAPRSNLESTLRFEKLRGETQAQRLDKLNQEIALQEESLRVLTQTHKSETDAEAEKARLTQKRLDDEAAQQKKIDDAAKAAREGAQNAAARARAQTGLVQERVNQEKIALDQLQALRAQALEQDYEMAVKNTAQTKAAQENIETAFAIRRLDSLKQAALEDAALQERTAIQIQDSKIAAVKAADAAAAAAATDPKATADAQVAASKRSAAAAIEVQTATLAAQNSIQEAVKKRTEAEAAYEKGVSAVVRGERAGQIKITEAQLQREAKLREQSLQGQEAVLSAATDLVQAQVDGLVLTREEGLAKTQRLERQALEVRRLLLEEQFQEELRQLKKRVAANEATEADILAIRARHTQDLQVIYIEQQTQAQVHQNKLLEGWIEWVKDVKAGLGDFLFRWMDGQVRSMKDVLLDLKSYFFRLIADMVAKAATSAIIVPILTAVVGSVGGGGGGLLAQASAAIGGGGTGGGGGLLGTAGTALSGIGMARQLMSFLGLDGLTGSIKAGLTTLREVLGQGLSDLFSSAATRASQAALENATAASELGFETTGQVGTGAAGAVSTAATVMGIAGGLAALGAGIYGALNASNNAAKAAYAASAAAGAAAAATAAISTGLLGAAAATAVGTGWTGIGLIVAAVMAVIGVVLDRVIKPAGPSLSVRAGGGLSIGTDGGQLAVQGDLGSRVTRREGVDRGMAEGVQAQLEAGLTSAVKSIVQTINAVALDPSKLAGPTNEALQRALAAVQPINSANAKKMAGDISEQLRFANIQLVGGMLEPINMAFEQLVDSDLKTQLERLPGTTMGLVDLFKNLNSQLDEMAKGENRDVLGQIQGTREAIERFGVRLATTAGDTAEQIVNSVITQFDDAIERTQPRKLVSDFSHNLATLITTFNERMTDGLQALVTLQKTQQTLEAAGLPGQAVGSQVDRLTAELAQQGEIFSTQIVTRALENLSSELDKIVIQPIQIQATTVDSLFSDSLAALNSLWLEWHRLEDAGIDATRIQEQFTKLLGGILESSKTLLTDALQRGTFPEFLDVLLSIPDALAKMNPVFERLKALGQAFAQVVGPIQQAISQREEQLRTPAERVDRTAQQIRELEAAIVDAGTSAEKALPLYAQLTAAITANAEAQIAAVQQVGAVIEQITTILDARLTTSQRLAQVTQQIADLQAGRRPGEQRGVTPPWVRISEVTPPPSTGPQTIEDLSQLVTLYGQQFDLMRQLIDAIRSGLDSIDQTLRADETVGQRAARLVATVTPRPDVVRIAREASPEELLRQAGALQDAIGAVRELIDVIEQGLQNIADILHANETISERAARLVEAVTRAVPSQDPEALIRLASGIGDALTAVRALIDAIQQGLQQIQDILHATETVTERAVRLVGAVPSTVGITDPEALITIAGQIGEALTAVRALIDLLQGGIDSIDSTLFSLLSVAEQSVDLQAKIALINTDIARAGAATPEQLITLVGLTQQSLSLQQQITQALESTLADLQSSFATTGSPASQLTDTRSQIAALQTLADTGAATPEQLQQLVDLNQQLLSLGTQFDLLDVQQEALDALKSLAPVVQDQIDASKSQEQLLTDSLIAIQDQLEAQLVVAQTTDAHLVAQLLNIEIWLKAQLEVAQSTEAQLVAQLVGIQTALLVALAVASDTETQLVIQLTAVQTILQAQLERLHNETLITENLLVQQLGQLTQQLLAQYGTANIQDIIRRIQEWQLDELRTLNKRLRDLFVAQPDAEALFGVQPILNAQSIEMGTQTGHLRSIDDQTNTVINKLDEIFKQLERPLRTTPAQSGGFLYASLNRAATGPLGYAAGGMVAAILEPGERVFPPPFSPAQTHALMTMNTAFPRFAGGGWMVPGSGDGDHVPVGVTSGSFVLNREASTVLTHTPRPMSGLRFQHGGVVSEATSRTGQASTVNHVTITIQVYQQPGQSGRELVDLITRQLKKEFRTRNDDSPFR